MGLGGYLTWTAVAREIKKRSHLDLKFLPIEQHGHFIKIVKSEIFDNNEDFVSDKNFKFSGLVFPIILNNPEANYCKQDTPERAFQRGDSHIIQQCCEVYGIADPDLRCYLDISEEEKKKADLILSNFNVKKDFVSIEPESKDNYTPNRAYSFEKWQKVVDEISKKITVVQIGNSNSRKLKNAVDLTGKTSFIQAAAIIQKSKIFMSSEGGLVHAASAVGTKSLVILTGYQTEKMVAYPQNINIRIAKHGPCGLKIKCLECEKEVDEHDYTEILNNLNKIIGYD